MLFCGVQAFCRCFENMPSLAVKIVHTTVSNVQLLKSTKTTIHLQIKTCCQTSSFLINAEEKEIHLDDYSSADRKLVITVFVS